MINDSFHIEGSCVYNQEGKGKIENSAQSTQHFGIANTKYVV